MLVALVIILSLIVTAIMLVIGGSAAVAVDKYLVAKGVTSDFYRGALAIAAAVITSSLVREFFIAVLRTFASPVFDRR